MCSDIADGETRRVLREVKVFLCVSGGSKAKKSKTPRFDALAIKLRVRRLYKRIWTNHNGSPPHSALAPDHNLGLVGPLCASETGTAPPGWPEDFSCF